MALDIPLPTALPQDDPEQYIPLLLSAIEGFLLARDVWEAADYPEAYSYMQALMEYIVLIMDGNATMLPIGTITLYGAELSPPGWLICDGAAISRADYAALFAAIGTWWGPGDGTTTFNLPNFTGHSPMGRDLTLVDIGQTAGARTHALTTGEMPTHSHMPTSGATIYTHAGTGTKQIQGFAGSTGSLLGTLSNTGGGAAHNNVHPVIGVNFMIFAGV